MAINENTKSMITALANNDIKLAKSYAKCIIANDNADKNKRWRDSTKAKLDSVKSTKMELPTNIQNMCQLMDVRDTFRADRYYITDAEKKVIDGILKKKHICERMAIMGVPVLNTTLLYGEPGTGKTTLAEYIAYILDKPLLIMKFSNLIDSYLGKTALNLSLVFDFVKANDVVLLIDEIDTIARKRSGESGCDGELSRTTVSIMQELDDLNVGTIVIAATNRVDLLDHALLRRFALKHEVKRMSEQEKVKQAELFFNSVKIQINEETLRNVCKKCDTPANVYNACVDMLLEYLETHEEKTETEILFEEDSTHLKKQMSLCIQITEILLSEKYSYAHYDRQSIIELYKRDTLINRLAEEFHKKTMQFGSTMNTEEEIRDSMHKSRLLYMQIYHTEPTVKELSRFLKERL